MKLNFLNIFKRPESKDLPQDIVSLLPSPQDDLAELIFNFFNKNQEDGLSTQFILDNGKSILVSSEMELVHMPGSTYLSVFEDETELVIIRLYNICAMGRVPKTGGNYR